MTFDIQKVSGQIRCAQSNESDPQLLRLCRLKSFEKSELSDEQFLCLKINVNAENSPSHKTQGKNWAKDVTLFWHVE